MIEVINEDFSNYFGKAVLLFPKCDSNHWTLYVIFNVYGEVQYAERSIFYLDSREGELYQNFIDKLKEYLVSFLIKEKYNRKNKNFIYQPGELYANSEMSSIPIKNRM